MEILENYSGSESDVCNHVIENINDVKYKDGKMTPSLNSLFQGSCALTNNDMKHRILIKKNSLGDYNLFSCYFNDEGFCTYELNK